MPRFPGIFCAAAALLFINIISKKPPTIKHKYIKIYFARKILTKCIYYGKIHFVMLLPVRRSNVYRSLKEKRRLVQVLARVREGSRAVFRKES